VPERFEGFHTRALFTTSSVMGRFTLHAKVLAPDIETTEIGPTKIKIASLSKTTIVILFKFQLFMPLVGTLITHRFP
jgi:hypothetical protein